jgi:hypothetical protein
MKGDVGDARHNRPTWLLMEYYISHGTLTVMHLGTRTETEMKAGKRQSVISAWNANSGVQFCDGQCRASAVLNRQRLITSRTRVYVAHLV